MIATVTLHTSQGVQNLTDSTKKMTWYKTPFNMPVPDYMANTTSVTRYNGAWSYLTETTSYNLSGFLPGMEVCVGHFIFDFDNNTASSDNVNTLLYARWCNTDGSNFSPPLQALNGYNFTYTLPAFSWTERWFGYNIGVAGWEITNNTNYRLTAEASGTPSIATTNLDITITNCPSTTLLGSSVEGYIWVEGSSLAYIVANQWKHSITGTYVNSTPGVSKAGSIWIDTSNELHWVTSTGDDYKAPWKIKQFASFYSNGATGEVYAGTDKAGYIWADSQFGFSHIAYIGYDGYKYLIGAGNYPYA
jgi:hypothetical protein